jgi:hypothetical protein
VGDGLKDGRHADRDKEPVPKVEALIDPFADVDGDDEDKSGDSPPTSDARWRFGHAFLS